MWEFAGDHPVWFLVYLLALLLVVAVTLTAVAASVQRIFETKYKALSDVARAAQGGSDESVSPSIH